MQGGKVQSPEGAAEEGGEKWEKSGEEEEELER